MMASTVQQVLPLAVKHAKLLGHPCRAIRLLQEDETAEKKASDEEICEVRGGEYTRISLILCIFFLAFYSAEMGSLRRQSEAANSSKISSRLSTVLNA